jgi:hypothetical protein
MWWVSRWEGEVGRWERKSKACLGGGREEGSRGQGEGIVAGEVW